MTVEEPVMEVPQKATLCTGHTQKARFVAKPGFGELQCQGR